MFVRNFNVFNNKNVIGFDSETTNNKRYMVISKDTRKLILKEVKDNKEVFVVTFLKSVNAILKAGDALVKKYGDLHFFKHRDIVKLRLKLEMYREIAKLLAKDSITNKDLKGIKLLSKKIAPLNEKETVRFLINHPKDGTPNIIAINTFVGRLAQSFSKLLTWAEKVMPLMDINLAEGSDKSDTVQKVDLKFYSLTEDDIEDDDRARIVFLLKNLNQLQQDSASVKSFIRDYKHLKVSTLVGFENIISFLDRALVVFSNHKAAHETTVDDAFLKELVDLKPIQFKLFNFEKMDELAKRL